MEKPPDSQSRLEKENETLHARLRELKEQMRPLKETNERLKILFEYASEAYFTYTLKGDFVDVNAAAVILSGYKREELIGKNIFKLKLFSPSQATKAAEIIAENAKGRSTGPDEFILRPKNRAEVFVNIRTFPFKSEDQTLVLAVARDVTEAKLVDEEIRELNKELEDLLSERTAQLRETEERYRLLVEQCPEAVVIHDGDTILSANAAAARLFKAQSPEDLVGEPADKLIHPSQRDIARERSYTVRGDGTLVPPREGLFVRLDGTAFSALVVSLPFKYQGKDAVLSICHDNTPRKEAEEALREREARLAAMMSAFDGCIYVCSREYRVEFMNDRLIERTGYDGTGKKCYEVLHDRDAVCPWCVNEQVFNGETVRWEIQSPKDKRWYYVVNTPLYHADGTVSKQSMILDITERKEAEEALRESELQHRRMLDSISDAIHVVDKDLRITLFNAKFKKWCEELGLEADPIGRTIFEVFPFLEEKVRDEYARVFDSGEVLITEENTSVAAREIITETRKIPIIEKGRVTGVVTAIRDITARRKAEKAALTASRMEATATLAGGIAHDFNNLMVGVLGYSELLLTEFADHADAVRMLRTVKDAAQRAGNLAQQMLAYAKGGKYQPRRMSLNDTIRDVLQMQGSLFPSRVQVALQGTPKLWAVVADATQMSQVVLSICGNAVEAIEEAGCITITTANIEVDETLTREHPYVKKGRYAKLTVQDTGAGMGAETLSKVFEPFYSTKFTGRGLGLSAVYGIVKNHDGYIWAESEQGRGATFTVLLPAAEAEIGKPRRPEITDLAGTETVLIIDESEMVLDTAKITLENLGYRVLLARTRRDAVRIAGEYKESIHLALVDVAALAPDGFDAVPLLRKARPDMKVILCSGYEPDGPTQALIDAGAEKLLKKPFAPHDLAYEIRMALGG